MLPAPIEHAFVLEGERYRLVEPMTRSGMRRIRHNYALAIAAAPAVLEALDGADLYAEVIARECLKEAPAFFWQELPPIGAQNGSPSKVVTCDNVPRQLWEAFRQEVDTFVGLIFRPPQSDTPAAATPGPRDAGAVAPTEALPPVFHGRAE